MLDWDKVIAEIKKFNASGDPIKDVLEKYGLTETRVIMYLIEELEAAEDAVRKGEEHARRPYQYVTR